MAIIDSPERLVEEVLADDLDHDLLVLMMDMPAGARVELALRMAAGSVLCGRHASGRVVVRRKAQTHD